MSNQTIDGVPRELALRLLLGSGSELVNARKELRALLDAPAAQPNGEPVAICDQWSRNVGEWGERLEANVRVIDASRLAPGQFLYTHPAPVTLCDCNQGRMLCRCKS